MREGSGRDVVMEEWVFGVKDRLRLVCLREIFFRRVGIVVFVSLVY